MIRVGIVGTNTSHAGVFAGLLNGVDGRPPRVEGARVVGVWSSGKEGLSGMHSSAAELAAAYRIDQVATEVADLIGAVDLALILDDLDGGALHAELARPFLEAGVATYVDKPMALTVEDAVGLFDLAERNDTPLMSCSALRFAPELDVFRQDGGEELSTLVSVGPGDWFNYGVHAVEAALAVRGPGAKQVRQFAGSDRDITVIEDDSGPRVVIGTLRDANTGFHLTGYGPQGVVQTEVADYQSFYANTMSAAVGMARTGTAPIDRQATLEVLAILAAGQRSATTGDAVRLSDVMPGGTA
ncbi:Oxidoreductase family, NAD-binding Rossmann fold [Actinopolymorpha cephalotaxi]|uniref:Dehydrogenase n=1 Tax=Actinopolymorpha cephalotaxi TaxID=504797 RepID=A0A1I3A6I1_9ACTN|nr:Gfo/Idh/MocA family oxidoreductase [Actinopolymorpha cephalotaxi]NYH85321.1 putative dehydrogenase [Actinopolymorpha cephalotaxi]SFH45530.1 Oxidoreductase family, NAD-binding Rossmann fold [Actinopolymorpha cephalotaxi]